MGRGRAPCCAKVGLNKGSWTPEEDMRLIAYISKYGHANWRALPKQAGLLRCGKSCRLRWINYLRPDLKRGNFTKEEEETIIKLHHSLGNKWSKIASCLPGRTDNEIKNIWNTHLKKKLASKEVTETTEETPSQSSSVTTNSVSNKCDTKHDNENTSKDMTNTLNIPNQPSDDLADFLEMKSVTSPLIDEPYLEANNSIWEMNLDMIPLMTSPSSSSLEEQQAVTNRIVSEETCQDQLEMQEQQAVTNRIVSEETCKDQLEMEEIAIDDLWNVDDQFQWNPMPFEDRELNKREGWLEHLERELGLWGEKQESTLCEMEGDPVSSYFQDEIEPPCFSDS